MELTSIFKRVLIVRLIGMKLPHPEDFGLFPDDLAALASWQSKVDAREQQATCVIALGIYIIGVVMLLPYFGWAALIFGLPGIFWGLLLRESGAIHYVAKCFAPARIRRHLRNQKRYLAAKNAYDARFIRTQSEFWASLSGISFEQEVAHLLADAGFAVKLTPSTGDKGVDILLGGGTIVQCKAHNKPIGPAIARELYGAQQALKARRSILVSRSGFTLGVFEFARDKPMALWDQSTLIEMQKKIIKRNDAAQVLGKQE